VTLGGEAIQLTPTEYRLVSALASRPDEILSRDDLATLVWGYQDASSGRTIDVHIRRLRVKLSHGPVPAPAIVAVRGFGYKMAVEDSADGAAA
jgi:two-component system response regulator MtrA